MRASHIARALVSWRGAAERGAAAFDLLRRCAATLRHRRAAMALREWSDWRGALEAVRTLQSRVAVRACRLHTSTRSPVLTAPTPLLY